MRFLIKNIKKKQLNNIIYAIVQLFMLFFIYLIKGIVFYEKSCIILAIWGFLGGQL